ncbi:hypothetical protein [Chryseolinea soli]|uniref:Uncharacterized protein n=1 Tax=Chryseolinea soli TaxID=2321403 RepID=A0A385SL70_9BACT|nr:hypothetical protein [Chryseolinea soli]AYB31017.1 hypothetical protein D4L85_10705 [Chryseolinea soli]
MKIIRPHQFYKAHKHLYKLVPVGLIIAAIYFIFLHKFEKDERPMGTYYAYHLTHEGDSAKALIIGHDLDCGLISKYANYMHDGAPLTEGRFSMDTILIPTDEPVELVGTECDSTVGIIKFKNRYFRKWEKEGKHNPLLKKGLVSLKDIHPAKTD